MSHHECSLPDTATVSALLVIDDDHDHAAIALHVITKLRPQLPATVAYDSTSAHLAITAAAAGTLVLIDRHLGPDDGLVLLRAAAGERPDMHFVLLSAVVTDEERLAALAAGAFCAAEKPARLDEWSDLFGRLLDSVEAPPS